MNAILGYISMAAVALFALAAFLLIIPIVNDGACASLELHNPLGKPIMQLLFVCWW